MIPVVVAAPNGDRDILRVVLREQDSQGPCRRQILVSFPFPQLGLLNGSFEWLGHF